jgi:hypothetical protein
VVECTGLENQRAARYRGFESHPLRKNTPRTQCGKRSPGEPSLLERAKDRALEDRKAIRGCFCATTPKGYASPQSGRSKSHPKARPK